ncbi:MAG: DUF2817 domain-containing protein [Kordiimonadaceae bacterium]|nr:DUF2817 domain-containing protein [Kordiimonadaceae bacterium]
MGSNSYFSNSYQDARQLFLISAEKAGATINSHVHPTEKDVDGRDLAIDVALLGPKDADVILMCVSGTHGPEGYCGSAAQIQSLSDGTLSKLPKGVAVVFIHALNPFGFAYMTRFNENNVDLNRNWVDFSNIPKTHKIYPDLNAVLPPTDSFTENQFSETVGKMARLSNLHSGFEIENALSAGQYEFADGLGYGGCKREWSSKILEQIVRSFQSPIRHIAYLDWHSLIRSGMDDFVYLSFNRPGGQLIDRCKNWWGAHNVDPKKVAAKWDQGLGREGGRPDRYGIVMWGVQDCARPAMDVAGGVVEFTDEPVNTFQEKVLGLRASLLSRYFVHTRDITSERGKKLYAESRELWCPTRTAWQTKTLARAQDIFTKTLNGATDWAAENVAVCDE